MTPYHNAIFQCAERYSTMMFDRAKADGTTEDLVTDKLWLFITELQVGCEEEMPIMKLNRWLGYIQGVLIERGYTTVQAERDWTRPLFRPLDFPGEY